MKKHPLAYVNGALLPESEAKISVFDRGFLYGDAVFETLRVYGGVPFQLEEHLLRLRASAGVLALEPRFSDGFIKSRVRALLEANSLDDACVRITLTRGRGERGLSPRSCVEQGLVITAKKYAGPPGGLYRRGVAVVVGNVRKTPSVCVNPAVKSSNCLNGILSRLPSGGFSEGRHFESVMLGVDGCVTEGSVSNVFMARKGKLITPSCGCGILPGITRATVMAIAARNGIEVSERIVSRDELFFSDECFITNSLIQVMPVSRICGGPAAGPAAGNVTAGRPPGEVTKLLLAGYREYICEYLAANTHHVTHKRAYSF